MKRLHAIFFDLDGTLIFSEPDPWVLYAQFAREFGLSITTDATRRAERFAHFYFAGDNSKADFEQFGVEGFRLNYLTRMLREMIGEGAFLADSGRRLTDVARFVMERSGATPRKRFAPDGTRETLERLRADGYMLGLITNRRDDEMADAYRAHELDQYFAFTVTSSEAGNPKPHRAMFDLALARSGCMAAAAIHIGDNLYADIAGAQSVGIATVLVDPKGLFPEADCHVIQ